MLEWHKGDWAVSETKAIEQLNKAEEMLKAKWTKMDNLEWKRWAFIMSFRLLSALVHAILSIKEEIGYWCSLSAERH